jgi:hypothetical protein
MPTSTFAFPFVNRSPQHHPPLLSPASPVIRSLLSVIPKRSRGICGAPFVCPALPAHNLYQPSTKSSWKDQPLLCHPGKPSHQQFTSSASATHESETADPSTARRDRSASLGMTERGDLLKGENGCQGTGRLLGRWGRRQAAPFARSQKSHNLSG